MIVRLGGFDQGDITIDVPGLPGHTAIAMDESSMAGAGMGTLDVEVSGDCITWVNVFTISGDQDDTWFPASIDLCAYTGSTVVTLQPCAMQGAREDVEIGKHARSALRW